MVALYRATITFLTLLLLVSCSSKRPPVARQPRLRPNLERMLEYYDARYNDKNKMLRVKFKSPGYHTRLLSGAEVHPTRESLMYALGLLQRDKGDDRNRAVDIIEQVLGMQDRREKKVTRGTWPYVLEEPIDQMPSVDMNWADFCGIQLAQMIVKHRQQLPDDLVARMKGSLREAALAIKRRDVAPSYTNIAVLGAIVCGTAGEILDDTSLVDYGRTRLQNVVRLTGKQADFTEYNSPPYTKVVMAECERAIYLIQDPQIRDLAEQLRVKAWNVVANSFHPPTQQWVGPHSRTSKDRLRNSMVEFLSERLGFPLTVHDTMKDDPPRGYAVVPPLPCPGELIARFKDLEPTELRRVFVPKGAGTEEIAGISWLGPTACLGSVNRSSFWTQRKPVIGYWQAQQESAAAMRVRVLLNGKDFASIGQRSTQARGRVLMMVEALANRGIWHRSLDRPANGMFPVTDLQIRIQLRGIGASAKRIKDSQFELACGTHRAIVHLAKGTFVGKPIKWEAKTGQAIAEVNGICFSGDTVQLDFPQLETIRQTIGLEILVPTQRPSTSKFIFSPQNQHVTWAGLSLTPPATNSK